LADVDLLVRPGEQIGICGPTGGGKSTLVDLITGLLDPTSGQITVDGRDMREVVREWHAALGVVPQSVFLIDDTLRANIALGVPADAVDTSRVEAAVELAQLTEFVRSLPRGLDTLVGERGVRISGGERQRIAIARALYRRPTVLVLDEGTSALDNETERHLMKAVEGMRGTRTVILVAHRLSTVRSCDRILFVENGRVSGADSFLELERTSERFRAMVARGE
jgi:ATP-binding cassette, subfamily B, bacterial PglK